MHLNTSKILNIDVGVFPIGILYFATILPNNKINSKFIFDCTHKMNGKGFSFLCLYRIARVIFDTSSNPFAEIAMCNDLCLCRWSQFRRYVYHSIRLRNLRFDITSFHFFVVIVICLYISMLLISMLAQFNWMNIWSSFKFNEEWK